MKSLNAILSNAERRRLADIKADVKKWETKWSYSDTDAHFLLTVIDRLMKRIRQQESTREAFHGK